MNSEDNQHKKPDCLDDEHFLLVKKIAKHMAGRLHSSIRIEDLFQSGMVGLLEAQNKYDPDKGASFSTFASIRIRGAMLDELRRGDWAPRSVHRNSRRILEAIREVEHQTGRDARDNEVATHLDISLDEYHKMLQDSNGVRVCEFEDSNNVLDTSDMLVRKSDSPIEAIRVQEFKETLAGHVSELPENERLVLALYYEEDLNLREVGEVLGVTESRISQIHSQAVHRLKARLNNNSEMASE